MNIPRAEAVPAGVGIVTVIPEAGKFEVGTPEGTLAPTPVELTEKEASARAAAFTAIVLAAGPGEHSLRYVSRASRRDGLTGASDAIRLASMLPRDFFEYGLSGDGREVVRIGQIAVAGRKPTEEEVAKVAETARRPVLPLAERREAETRDLDPYKIDLTGFDHTSVRVGDRMFEMRLDTREALLAARVLGKLSHFADSNIGVDATKISQAIWDSIPLAERMVHGVKDAFGTACQIGKHVDAVIDQLTGKLEVTRRRGTVRKYRLLTNDIALRFEQTPRQTPIPADIATIYAPGSNPELVLGEIPKGSMTVAAHVLVLAQQRALSQSEALTVLGAILDRDSKRALHKQLEQSGSGETLSSTIGALDRLARRSLGEGYYAARAERTPYGKTAEYSGMRKAPASKGIAARPIWRIV